MKCSAPAGLRCASGRWAANDTGSAAIGSTPVQRVAGVARRVADRTANTVNTERRRARSRTENHNRFCSSPFDSPYLPGSREAPPRLRFRSPRTRRTRRRGAGGQLLDAAGDLRVLRVLLLRQAIVHQRLVALAARPVHLAQL